jgi:hypothetical protein
MPFFIRSLRIVHLSQERKLSFARGDLLYRVVLLGIIDSVCSVNLWRLLGNTKKPEKQEVNENNKEEIEVEKARNRSEYTYSAIESRTSGCMWLIFHLIWVK